MPPADHQSAPSVPANSNGANHPPSPRLYSAAQLPSGQSLLPKQDLSFVKQPRRQRPVAQTSAVAVSSIASLVPLDTRNSMAALLARRHRPKKKRKGRPNCRRMMILSPATMAASSRGAIFQIATSAVPRVLNATPCAWCP